MCPMAPTVPVLRPPSWTRPAGAACLVCMCVYVYLCTYLCICNSDSRGPCPAGDKYSVFLIPDPERLELSTGQQPQQRERAAFRIVPSKYAVPAQAPGWQVAIAVLLLVFAAGTSFQTGLVANTATLPQVLVHALSEDIIIFWLEVWQYGDMVCASFQ